MSDTTSYVAKRPPRVSLSQARRAINEPTRALSHLFALVRGAMYRILLPLLGRQFTAGPGLAVFGRLSVRGPGQVIIGRDVAIWGRVNAWTYNKNARLEIGDQVMLSDTKFGCAQLISIGADCILADASLRDTDFHSTRADRRSPEAPVRVSPIRVERNVWVGAAAILLPDTVIGENSVVSAGAVCMRSYPADKVILGNPAKVAMPIPSLSTANDGSVSDLDSRRPEHTGVASPL